MSDSVVKLRVDSQEYDAKIRRAADGLRAFGENCRKAGESVTKADKDTLDYVRAIGQMETVAKNTKGKINEMTTAFTELSVQYKNLTDEEKQSPFGQALAQSLDQLKNRIGESKAQLTEVNGELGNTSKQSDETGGVLDALAGKFGLNINQAGAFGIALGVTTTAAKVAKDAFFSNEEQLDEWGRTVAASESLYKGFLDALNTGDISGFLSNIASIVSAARDAYDALDTLATFNAFNQVNVARTRQQLMNAQNDFREGTGSKEQVKSAAGAYKGELEQRRQLEKKAYSAAIVDYAKRRGVDAADLARVMLGSYGDYNKIKSMPLTGTQTTIKTNMYGQQWTQTTKVAANEMERMGEMLRRFNDDELRELQGLGAKFFQTGFEKGQIDRQVNRLLNSRQGGAGTVGGGRSGDGSGGGRTGGSGRVGGSGTPPPPEGSIAAQEAKVQALTKAWRMATDETGRAGYAGQLEEAKKLLDEMQGKVKEVIPEGSFRDLNNQLQELQKKRELLADPIDVAIIDEDIEHIKEKINELNGVLPKSNQPKASLEERIRTSVSDSILAVDEATLTNLMEFKIKNGLDDLEIPSEYLEHAIFGEKINIPDEFWQNLVDQINEKLKEKGRGPITLDVETGDVSEKEKAESKFDKAFGSFKKGVGGLSSITGGLEQMGVKVPESINKGIAVMQGLISVIEGVQAVISIFSTSAQAVNTAAVTANTVAVGALTTAMITNTAVSAIPLFAGGGLAHAAGGLLTGHHFSGDNVPVMVNDGELILNRAQQGVIADDLRGATPTIQIEGVISGENIKLVQKTINRRTGKGEFVTTKMR